VAGVTVVAMGVAIVACAIVCTFGGSPFANAGTAIKAVAAIAMVARMIPMIFFSLYQPDMKIL
jgi:hypothetical protein